MQHLIGGKLLKELQHIRRTFHSYPELSGEEVETAKRVVALLAECKPNKILSNVGGNGVIALFDSGISGETVMFRAELDALPIHEINRFEHRSQYSGVGHKCGHDGHLTILLGLAKVLSENPPKKGKVALLFQPAEENGDGAEAVLADPKFQEVEPDYIFAFHNLPGYPLHRVIYKTGSFTASVKSIIINLSGKTAHAGEPEMGINPALAIAEIIEKTRHLSNNEPSREDFTLITPIHIRMGELAYGISAGEGELHFTMRTWNEQYLDRLSREVVDLAKTITEKFSIRQAISWTQHFRSTENNDDAITHLTHAIKEKGYVSEMKEFPFKWGEDFGLFTQKYKGAMFGIGSGENCPALHNPDYDFPDEIIPTGIELFYSIQSRILSNK